jgi:PIN domain nuclease of toxin-antitoxin system
LVLSSYLLDTHVLHWLDCSPKLIPRKTFELLSRPNSQIYASSINAWEMQIKHQLGNWTEVTDFLNEYFERILEYQMRDLAFSSAHALELKSVPLIERADRPGQIHRDEFDRALIAQALHENLVLVSSDVNIRAYTAHLPKLIIAWD